ncbi:hypothetical protein KUCAC02_000117 [Chaenocephalus aceratus]|nr:hypothetical protein KUCAC02_000117 [Chaenocephalus aceratus]
MEALADTVLEKQRGYLDSRFDQLQQMGRETEGKLTSIHSPRHTPSYTVKRRQAFSRAMDTARAKGVKTFNSPGHAEDFIVSLPGVQDAPTGGDGDPGPGRSSDGE